MSTVLSLLPEERDAVETQSTPTESSTITLQALSTQVSMAYGNDLAAAMRAVLGVIGALSLTRRDHCIALFLVGGSGVGKSTVARFCMPETEAVARVCYRADNFTRASFVSHSAKVEKGELEKIDLLPRITNKTMITKELGALFSAEETVLRETFGTLTTVLDGNGLVTNSGSHGERGYTGEYLFNWIGATTPPPRRVYELMSQVGNRMLFYEIPERKKTRAALMEFAKSNNTGTPVAQYAALTNQFIEGHFERYPVNSVDPSTIHVSDELTEEMVCLADFIAHGRVRIDLDPDGFTFERGIVEAPERLILLLRTLALGLALTSERNVVTTDDIAVLRHIAFSTIPPQRREIVKHLINAGGELTSTQLQGLLGFSAAPTLRRMREVGATGIATARITEQRESTASTLALKDEWRWLLEG
jgi:hypothetical protein